MPLNAADVAALSRLLDEAAALPADQQAAWLAALPAPQQHLAPHLRRMLALTAGYHTDALLSEHLPHLPDLRDERGPDGMPGDVIGPYRLKSVLGRGGMGTVWLAERADGIFEREVALKLPMVDRGPQLAERMARERQIAARLEHPNIARLYEAGIDPHGRPYLVLERVQGLGLLAHCDTRRLPRDARLRLLLQLCAAVAHAHAQLVVHRDIKPSNLMVDSAGQLKLLDFGISRWLQGPAGGGIGTGTSTDLGHTHTPGYAAPEQREGRPVSTRADIYSIGAVAHVLLTGDLPPPGAGAAPLHRARLGPDLHAVLDQALQADPAQRYSSVERLADDLRCVLAQRSVQARRAGWPHRTALFVRRHRRPLVAATAAGLLLASAIGVALQRHARERAQQEQTAQARNFLFAFMEDADFTEGTSSAPITAAQMVERAIQRARDDFPGQPALRGSVLANLGIVLRRIDPGQPQRALALLREAHGLLEAGAEPDDPALHIAELLLRRGDGAGARAQLLALIARHKARPATGAGAGVDLAQALDLLGAAERREGRFAAAGVLHAEAAALLAEAIPPDHPLRLRNALDAALAQALGESPTPQALHALAAAVQRYQDRLPADSGWRQVLGTLPAHPAAGISWVL